MGTGLAVMVEPPKETSKESKFSVYDPEKINLERLQPHYFRYEESGLGNIDFYDLFGEDKKGINFCNCKMCVNYVHSINFNTSIEHSPNLCSVEPLKKGSAEFQPGKCSFFDLKSWCEDIGYTFKYFWNVKVLRRNKPDWRKEKTV